jgi:hypothetical protein
MIQNIYALVDQVTTRYRSETNQVDVVEGLSFSMYHQLIEIEFLSSQHYMIGDKDEDGQLRPFLDVTTRILENQRAAEEIDTADVVLTTKDPDYYTRALLLDRYNHEWMQENRIDQFINDAIEVRGKYGGLLVKVIEDEDNIEMSCVDWTTFAGDEADLENGVKVLTHFFTPADLIEKGKKNGWDMDMVYEAVEFYAETEQEGSEFREQRETNGNYVLVRETVGVLPRTMLDPDADPHDYVWQIHYTTASEFNDANGINQGKTLYSEELDRNPFYYLPYKKRGGNSKLLGVGMVERAKHSQVQSNRAAQQWKKALDFSSTHVLQSASQGLQGKNVLTQIKPGTIIKVDDGKPIQGVDMTPQAIVHLDRYLASWQNTLDRATGTFSVATGESLPSGTPYRLGAILDQNAQSSFDLRREEFGIILNRIYKERIIPFFIRQIKNTDELNLKFNADQLEKMDYEIETRVADEQIINNYFAGAYAGAGVALFEAMGQDRMAIMQGLDQELKKGRNRRKIKNDMGLKWRKYWDDCEGKIFAEITNEARKKGVMLESVNNVLLQYLQYKPQLDQDPEARKMFNDIVQIAGLSPIDFSNSAPTQPAQGANPQPMQEEQELATSAKPR